MAASADKIGLWSENKRLVHKELPDDSHIFVFLLVFLHDTVDLCTLGGEVVGDG